MSIDIEQNLCNRFAAPLADNYKRRIIFWQDPDGEFAGQVDKLCPDGAKVHYSRSEEVLAKIK